MSNVASPPASAWLLPLTILLALPACEKRSETQPVRSGPPLVQAEHVRWEGEHEHTPELGGRELVVAAASALHERKVTVTLHGRYRVPALYRARYGEDVSSALRVVAVNEEIHRAWTAPLEVMAEGEAIGGDPMSDEAGEGGALEGTFNMVMRDALALPYQSATYTVFLWLDELVSEGIEVVLPEGARVPPHSAPLTGTIWLTETSGPDAASTGVTIELDPDNAGEVLGAVRRVPGSPRIPLMILGLARPGDTFSYNRAQFPVTPGADAHDGQNFRFDLQATDLFRAAPTEGRIWTLALFGGRRSSVLAVPVAAPRSETASEHAGASN